MGTHCESLMLQYGIPGTCCGPLTLQEGIPGTNCESLKLQDGIPGTVGSLLLCVPDFGTLRTVRWRAVAARLAWHTHVNATLSILFFLLSVTAPLAGRLLVIACLCCLLCIVLDLCRLVSFCMAGPLLYDQFCKIV